MAENTNIQDKKSKKSYMPQKLKSRAFNYDQTLLKVFGNGENKKIKLTIINDYFSLGYKDILSKYFMNS